MLRGKRDEGECRKTKREKEGIDRKEQKEGGVKKMRRGMRALKEIKKYQTSTELLIRKLLFQRLVKRDCARNEALFTILEHSSEGSAEAGEAFLVRLFEQVNFCAMHTKCVTVMLKDIQLTR